jgi:hypothetical protein
LFSFLPDPVLLPPPYAITLLLFLLPLDLLGGHACVIFLFLTVALLAFNETLLAKFFLFFAVEGFALLVVDTRSKGTSHF